MIAEFKFIPEGGDVVEVEGKSGVTRIGILSLLLVTLDEFILLFPKSISSSLLSLSLLSTLFLHTGQNLDFFVNQKSNNK